MKTFLLLVIVFQSLSCANKTESGEFPTLEFRYDGSLLSSSKIFEGISLSIPINFNQVVGNDFLKIEKNLETIENSFFFTDILFAFQNESGGVIIISKVNAEKPIIKRLGKEFEKSLVQSSNAIDTNRGQFLINGTETVQFITSKNDIVNYKLFFNVMHNICYQIDYFVLLDNFVKFQPYLESSISTLKINN